MGTIVGHSTTITVYLIPGNTFILFRSIKITNAIPNKQILAWAWNCRSFLNVLRTLSNIYDERFCKNSKWVKAVSFLWKTLYYKYLTGSLMQGRFKKFFPILVKYWLKDKQEKLCVVKIAMIYSTLASLWKFQYFWRPIYNLVEHLWWSFYCENSKSLSLFTKKLHHRCSLGF